MSELKGESWDKMGSHTSAVRRETWESDVRLITKVSLVLTNCLRGAVDATESILDLFDFAVR